MTALSGSQTKLSALPGVYDFGFDLLMSKSVTSAVCYAFIGLHSDEYKDS